MKTFFLIFGLLVSTCSFGQTVETRLAAAMQSMEKDDQFKHAVISLYVIDSKTVEKNSTKIYCHPTIICLVSKCVIFRNYMLSY